MSPGRGDPSFSLAGGHDFDEAWVSDVRHGVGGGAGARSGNAGVTKVCMCVCLCMYVLGRLLYDHLNPTL